MRALTSMDRITDALTKPIRAGRLLQDLAPIYASIPWLRSQRYWSQAGLDVFTAGEVPYVITNDGTQSCNALEVYLASLRAADQLGSREKMSYILEVGTGSGLFAKLFLDQLKARCEVDGNDFYERTTYLLADTSPGLLEDTRTSGVFAKHEARVSRVLLRTHELKVQLAEQAPEALGNIRAVHGNYVLDSVPFTILSQLDQDLYELRLRTRIREDVLPSGAVVPSTTDVQALEEWLNHYLPVDSPLARTAFSWEAEYVPVSTNEVPYIELRPAASSGAVSGGYQWVHSFGAVRYLSDTLAVLKADGYALFADYGSDGARTEPIEFQTFGMSLACGVNFSQLVTFAGRFPDFIASAPEIDPPSLQARLFARSGADQAVIQTFRIRYDKAESERVDLPYRDAIDLASKGRFEEARWKFDEALRAQPCNWSLLESMTAFLTYTLEDHYAGLEVGKRALELNHVSPRLWNLLGDCYYGQGNLDSAEQAYLQAIHINSGDVRGRANLAYVFLRRGEAQDALRIIGEALALDRACTFRDELVGKQGEAIQLLNADYVREMKAGLKLLSGQHATPERLRAR